MGAEKFVAWAKEHPMPAAIVAGGGLAVTLGLATRVFSKKKSTTNQVTSTYAIPNKLVPGTFDFGSDLGFSPFDGGSTDSGSNEVIVPTGSGTGSPSTAPPPAVLSPQSSTAAPTPTATPFALPQVDASQAVGFYNVSNPQGSALRDSLASINQVTGFQSYTPSALDFQSEQPGGLNYAQVNTLGGSPGNTYLVYNNSLGSGPIIPDNQRISGERYDSYGRVIA